MGSPCPTVQSTCQHSYSGANSANSISAISTPDSVLPVQSRMGGQKKQNFVITPHKRRGPIAAEFQTPGPAAVTLPGLFGNQCLKESTKAAAPAFSFAGKHEQKVKNFAPSPNTYNTAGLTARGKDVAPAKTIAGRGKDLKLPEVPAPNAYNTEKGEDYLEGGIQHSFGIKPEIKNKFLTPSPNAYNADKGEDYLEGGIQHSFGIKPEIKNKFLTPPPNAYNAEKGEDYLEGGIQHSFGIKPEIKNTFVTPSPNAYNSEKGEDYLEGGIQHS